MPDFNVRSDSVNVEQIMEQIRARIREKRGVDYTEQEIHQLAAVKLEKFLDPRGVRSDLLDQMIAIVSASTLIAYIFYTISPETAAKFGTEWLGLTIPFPLYGIFRYLYLVHRREGGGSPADLLINDRPLLACVLAWVAAVVVIIYQPF